MADGHRRKGNAGVARRVQQTTGAIGYVEQAYALQNKFTTASVKNKAGKFVAPTLESTSAAADGITLPPDLRFSAINSTDPAAYPIAVADVHPRLQGHVQGGREPSGRLRREEVRHLRPRH